jgi:fatty acid desaturase
MNPSHKINWYRSPIDRDTLARLNQRSDARGLMQTLGHLGILVVTGGVAWYASAQWGLWATLLALFLHGTVYAFLLNGFHELCHGTVFKTKWLNTAALNVVSFLGGFNPVFFWTSHQEHHKYTLHPPDDLEVVLPVELSWAAFLKSAVFNPWKFVQRIGSWVRFSQGRLEGQWEHHLFPDSEPERKRRLVTWARVLLFGHGALWVVSLLLGWWMLPILVTLAPFYGGWLLYLCNNTQHAGLQDYAPDFRLCTRTILLNPAVRFLYWHMNYHIEHHMFAAVPCYNLHRLHLAIRDDLPPSPRGLLETWRQIIGILREQKVNPDYQFQPELPKAAS